MTLKDIQREADYHGLVIRSTKTHYVIKTDCSEQATELARVAKSEGLAKLQEALDRELYAEEGDAPGEGNAAQWR